jgi:hypothetical protein
MLRLQWHAATIAKIIRRPAGPRFPGSAETGTQTIKGVQRRSQKPLRRFCRRAGRALFIDHLSEGGREALSLSQMLASTFGPILGLHSGAHICSLMRTAASTAG